MRRLPLVLGLACMALATNCILNRAGDAGGGGAGAGGEATTSSSGGSGPASSSSAQGGMAGSGGATASSSSTTASGGGDGGADWPKPGYGHRRPITIPAGSATGLHNDFPVLIGIDRGAYPLTGMMNAGEDLLFTDGNHADLPYEIDFVDANNVYAWVKLPVLDAAASTQLYVYYNHASPPAAPDPTTVWSPHFLAVFHMNEDPGPNNAKMLDSAGDHDADTTNNMSPADLEAGIIGQSLDFDGEDERLSTALNLGNVFTISMWIHPDNMGGMFANPSLFTHASLLLDCWLRTEDPQNQMALWSGNPTISYLQNANLPTGEWQHVVYRVNVNNTAARHYYNGTGLNVGNAAADTSTNGTFHIAGRDSWYYNGRMDEVHVSTVLRSEAWITTEHDNQVDPQAFIMVGNEESP